MSDAPRTVRRRVVDADALADPLDVIAHAPGEAAFYWRCDDRDTEIAALGVLHSVEAGGRDRFGRTAAWLQSLQVEGDEAGSDSLPVAVGGFAFGDGRPPAPWTGFPALRFFAPRVLWTGREGHRRMVLQQAGPRHRPACEIAAESPGRDHERRPEAASDETWKRRVTSAVDAIRAGRLEKIVLARRRAVDMAAGLSAVELVRELAASRPSCFTFLVRLAGRCFVGSSPERLLRVHGNDVDADALAGTAPRGRSKTHDEATARELVASPKEQREHRIVVDAMRSALEHTADVETPAEPVVLELPEAHHLHTPLRARLRQRSPAALFDLAGRLHPTPAVCGSPRDAAFSQLVREEPDRGWYGGGVGWVTAGGDGELAVALRAALLDGRDAHVWAGAGVVEGSEPAREHEETERKMRSILPLLERGDDECAA